MKKHHAPTLAVVALLLLASTVTACSVPVFRYALEHWQPDSYVAVVFHRGELSDDQRELIAALQPGEQDDHAGANLVVQTVDLDADPDEALLTLWQEQETEALPWVAVNSPLKHAPPQTVWAGELTSETTTRVMNSPMRERLAKQLINGASVVWVFLDSGDSSVDDAAYELLEQEVTRLESELELPEIEEADLEELSLDPAALKLKMSTLRVARDNPAEKFLVDSLLRVEPDLMDEPYVGQPMAFPVFGRGRALYALVGDGITSGTIEEAGQFLTGACQCTVKAQNPGVDLLMPVDWDKHISPALPYDDSQPELAGLGSFAPIAEPDERSAIDTDETHREAAAVAASDHSETESSIAADDSEAVEAQARDNSAASKERETVADERSPVTSATPGPEASSLTGSVLLVVGLLAMCVIVATIVLIPRSR